MREDISETLENIGADVTFRIRGEGDVVRDDYHSIKRVPTDTELTVKCYPIETGQERRNLDRAGITVEVDYVIWTSSKEWTDRGYDFEDLDINRMTVVYNGATYEVEQKQRQFQIQNVYGYWVFGVRRK
ncbi:MAG: hypothetical protein GF388_08540 [Candidatus Aegiribacteria sp.]|nr:hypothetical protein [Candidatus Aegiribacteria sp.]